MFALALGWPLFRKFLDLLWPQGLKFQAIIHSTLKFRFLILIKHLLQSKTIFFLDQIQKDKDLHNVQTVRVQVRVVSIVVLENYLLFYQCS